MTIIIDYEKLDKNIPDLKYQYKDDCCFDITSAVDIIIWPDQPLPTKVPTGIRFAIPRNYELQIRPRSGLAVKNGITVFNSPGTIDNYTGEVQILLINISDIPFEIKKYDRIAQGKIAQVPNIVLRSVVKIKESERGANGLGSTSVK